MAVSIPITGFLTCQFRHSGVRDIQWFEQLIEMLGVRKIKNKFFKGFCIFKSIFYGLADTLNLEKAFKVFKIFKKEIKQVFSIVPLSEQ